MTLRNSENAFGAVAKLFHWGIAALLALQVALGLLMTALPLSAEKFAQFARHKSLGIAILIIALARAGWRIVDPPPPPVAGIGPWQRRAAGAVHFGLYGLLILLPLTGWALSDAANTPVRFIGLWTLPSLVAPSAAAKSFLTQAHHALVLALGLVTALHAAAALYHHFMRRDPILRRMLPFVSVKEAG
jgi:cytochrome b561